VRIDKRPLALQYPLVDIQISFSIFNANLFTTF